MRSAEISFGLIGIEMFVRNVTKSHINRRSPIEKIGRCRSSNPADAIFESTKKTDVALLVLGPENVVLRIKCTAGDNWFILQFVKMNSVFGNKSDQPRLAAATYTFEAFRFRYARA